MARNAVKKGEKKKPFETASLSLFLEHLDGFLVSVLKYVLSAILLFSLAIALYSFFSGNAWSDFSVTQAGANTISAVVALALIIFWRELREIRLWLEGMSEHHSRHTYSRLDNSAKRKGA